MGFEWNHAQTYLFKGFLRDGGDIQITVDFNPLWLSGSVVANEAVNLGSEVGKFAANFGTKFVIPLHGTISTVTNCLTQQGKATLSTGQKRIVDHCLEGKGPTQRFEISES